MSPLGCCLIVTMAFLATAAHADQSAPPPYAGQQTRAIKALSEQEVSDYLAGKGMGLAKAAELHGYPGPAHVLELAAALGLSAEQRARTEQLFRDMQAKASATGQMLVDAERHMDQLFATKTVTTATLRAALQRIADAHMQVRAIHLEAHLTQAAVLSPEQMATYATLRGYTASSPHTGHPHGASH